MDFFVGEIRALPFTFAPTGWLACNGQMVSTTDYGGLFTVIGTTYGGDGSSEFAMPNLNGSLAVGTGQQSNSGSFWTLGQQQGSATATVPKIVLPQHNHTFNATGATATSTKPAGQQLAVASIASGESSLDVLMYSDGVPDTAFIGATLPNVGGDQPHNNIMPYQAIVYFICAFGNIASRPDAAA